ncbi:MAG: hypothetical protein JWQ34_348 [Mucilaginibacter sp.]|uniref:hypothetical protein n=1 Tax=Mucilaginibacter sp. TaxID=1882438 RepID=UPI00260A83F4|nr:hypothetical protein [Mucilaginibacter sp.]MDB5002123.1 hypothetical protein [Mucilaginibacter sp.]
MIKRSFLQIPICLLAFMAITGCSNASKFDRKKWIYGDGLEYPLRDEIVNDLVKNHQLKGLTFRQILDSLGRPQHWDTLQLSYQILDNSFEFARKKPIHKKNLVISFSKDSVAVKAEIYEHTDKEKKK